MAGELKGEIFETSKTALIYGAALATHVVSEWLSAVPWIAKTASPNLITFVCYVLVLSVVVLVVRASKHRTLNAMRRSSKLRGLEGVWAQQVTIAERPFSIAIISFSNVRQRWIYRGVGLSKTFIPAAEWITYSLDFDEVGDDRHWFFAGHAWLRTYDEQLAYTKPHGGKGSVLPRLTIPENQSAGVMQARVIDLDVGEPGKFFDAALRRVPADTAAQITTLDAILALNADAVKEILVKSGIILKGST